MVVFEFKVGGMTCVACSGTVENHMKKEFGPKQMVEINVALLCHKMTVSFNQSAFIDKIVTPEIICEEIDMIGFVCELISITEVQPDDLRKKIRAANDPEESCSSFDS